MRGGRFLEWELMWSMGRIHEANDLREVAWSLDHIPMNSTQICSEKR